MKLDGINIPETVTSIKKQIDEDGSVSPALKVSIELMLLIVTLLCNRLGLNSQNSSKPPSVDPNREKKTTKKTDKKPGGQKGRKGTTLSKYDAPDVVKKITVKRSKLGKGQYKEVGVETRQVVDIEFKRVVTEYQAQILADENGKRIVAEFPPGISRPIQYGKQIKAHAVYLSQYQLLPYERISEYFSEQLAIPISEGSVYNFISEAYEQIAALKIDDAIKQALTRESIIHCDETGINIGGKRQWLHSVSSARWTWFTAHQKRGQDAMDEAGVLPDYAGIVCHDHWKPYYKYEACQHALCNAHHLRELTRAYEQDKQQWAEKMRQFLLDSHDEVEREGGMLNSKAQKAVREAYREILTQGELESPPAQKEEGKRGRVKKTKSRNLLERLRDFEDDVLRFIIRKDVPFTNNQGENDIRMTKVHQKISGCFRSDKGAKMFCAIRSYLSCCRKQEVTASAAMSLLFSGHLPDIFIPGAE